MHCCDTLLSQIELLIFVAASITDLVSSAEPTDSSTDVVTGSAFASEASVTATTASVDPERPTIPNATSAETEGATATAAANGTSSASNTTSASNSTSTGLPSSSLNETNDPHECHATTVNGEKYPFCSPATGETLYINQTYYGKIPFLELLEHTNKAPVTWDPTAFSSDGNVTIELTPTDRGNPRFANTSGAALDDETFPQTVPTEQGFIEFNITEDMLNLTTSGNLTFWFLELDSDEEHLLPGPNITLINNSTESEIKNNSTSDSDNSSGGGSKSKNLGEKVGAPIGTIAFVAILAILAFFLFRRYRSRGGGGGDYLSGKSHSQRTSTGNGFTGGSSVGGHRRTESFHDEPTRGMELQDRQRSGTTNSGGGADNWDWGRDSVSPPTSPGGTSNVFRDEIQRQRTGGGGRR